MRRAVRLAIVAPWGTACAALVAACSSSGGPNAGAADGGVACERRAEPDAYDCAEARFWAAFHSTALDPRQAAEQTLIAVIAAVPSPAKARGASLMHFRLAQLRLAMALENGQKNYVVHAEDQIVGELDRAIALDAYDGIIAPWKDAMQIATAAALQDWTDAVPLAKRGFDNVALNPMGNTLSLSGTTIGFPLSSGVPQTTASLLDRWSCSGVVWCTANTAHAPFARPGLGYHFAEAYARIGDRAKATAFLDEAAAAPDYDAWPYRGVVDAARGDVDGFLAKFASLGQDGSAFDVVYANQPYGCVFCHASGPASDR
jgi:hypothetical protein